MSASPHRDYDIEIAERIVAEYASGKTLTEISRVEGMPTLLMMYKWRADYEEFRIALENAQEAHADSLANQTIEISDTERDAGKSRNRILARQWLAGKVNRAKYGERVDVNQKIALDVTSLISEAGARLLPMREQHKVIDAQAIEVFDTLNLTTTDKQSDTQGESAPLAAQDMDHDIFS
jgi:hypothetical protein